MTPTPLDRARAARSVIQRMKTVLTLVDGVVDHHAARTVAAGLGEVVRSAERAEVAAVAHAEGSIPVLGEVDLVAEAERAARLLAGLVGLAMPALLSPRDADGRPDRQALSDSASPLDDVPYDAVAQAVRAAAAAVGIPFEALLELAIWPPNGEPGPDPVRRVALALTGRIPGDGLEDLRRYWDHPGILALLLPALLIPVDGRSPAGGASLELDLADAACRLVRSDYGAALRVREVLEVALDAMDEALTPRR